MSVLRSNKPRDDVSPQRVRELLSYDHEIGRFVRLVGLSNRSPAGVVFHQNGGRYVFITVAGSRLAAHRLAWVLFYGVWPLQCIDHINGIRDDNRITNLRDVPFSVNNQNQRAAQGVSFDSSIPTPRPWRAKISVNNRTVNLGRFATAEEARRIYIEAKRALHVGCTL